MGHTGQRIVNTAALLGACLSAAACGATSETATVGRYTATVVTYAVATPDSVVEHLADSATVQGTTLTLWGPPGAFVLVRSPSPFAVGTFHGDSGTAVRILPQFTTQTANDSGHVTITQVTPGAVAGTIVWRGFDYRLTATFTAAVR